MRELNIYKQTMDLSRIARSAGDDKLADAFNTVAEALKPEYIEEFQRVSRSVSATFEVVQMAGCAIAFDHEQNAHVDSIQVMIKAPKDQVPCNHDVSIACIDYVIGKLQEERERVVLHKMEVGY